MLDVRNFSFDWWLIDWLIDWLIHWVRSDVRSFFRPNTVYFAFIRPEGREPLLALPSSPMATPRGRRPIQRAGGPPPIRPSFTQYPAPVRGLDQGSRHSHPMARPHRPYARDHRENVRWSGPPEFVHQQPPPYPGPDFVDPRAARPPLMPTPVVLDTAMLIFESKRRRHCRGSVRESLTRPSASSLWRRRDGSAS